MDDGHGDGGGANASPFRVTLFCFPHSLCPQSQAGVGPSKVTNQCFSFELANFFLRALIVNQVEVISLF